MLVASTRRRRRPAATTLALVLLEACGVSSSAANGTSGGSPAPSDAGSSSDAALLSDGGGAAQPTLPTTALFVHASPSLPDIRLCWSSGETVAAIVPFPGSGAVPGGNYAGVPVGGGAALSEVGELASGHVILYAIDAENLARLELGEPAFPCDKLICDAGPNPPYPCLRPNTDYWTVEPLPSVLGPGANIVALAGCLGSMLDPLASPERCGPTWTAVDGNLHAEVARLSSMTPQQDAGQLVVQAALLSPAVASDLGDAGAAVVTFDAQDGGLSVVLGGLEAEGQVAPAQVLDLGTDLAAFGTLGFSVQLPGAGDSGTDREWMSLAQVQQLVDPAENPLVFYGQPGTYLIAILGAPDATLPFDASGNGGYDGTGLHLLVLASPPPPPPDAGDDAEQARDR